MAFVPGSIANKLGEDKTATEGGFVPGSLAGTLTQPKTGRGEFKPGSIAGGRPSAKSLQTSQGLYNFAVQSGYQADADRVMSKNTGEKTKEIFSGGFISDIFDTLNALDYGVVGLLKGKSFLEGVQTRQSFSDEDALGKYGIPGTILGIALDIAVDPLTYIAPMTILKNIPGATKLAKVGKELAFGKNVIKSIDTGIEGLTKSYETIEGGSKAGKWFADKFVWMFGQDPIYKEAYERSIKNIAVGTENIANLAKGVSALGEETAGKILAKDATGRFMRKPIEQLKDILKPEEFEAVAAAYTKIDDLGREAVELGLLSQGKFEENFGTYLKNAYEEYEKAGSKFGFSKAGVKGVKKRVEGLSEEAMKELGQIDNPAYLVFKSAFDLHKDIENVKLFNQVAKQFGTDVAQTGFKQLPVSQRLFNTSTGEKMQMLTKIKNLNQDLKPLFSNLKDTFKADREVLGNIARMEKEFAGLAGLRSDEFAAFFNEGIVKTTAKKGANIIKGVGKLPEKFAILGDDVRKFKTYNQMLSSDTGLVLEKLYQQGDLERAGFKSMKDFYKYVTEPFAKTGDSIRESLKLGDVNRLIQVQKDIEKLLPKIENVASIDKRSINDSFRFLEDSINKINMEKGKIIEQLPGVKLGELSGKYVPENVFNALQEVIKPVKSTITDKVVAGFKFGKVILNPATHARNMMSNPILNWWKLGIGPWRADLYAEAVKQTVKGGKWADEARTVGFGLDTFAANEIKTLLDSKEALGFGSRLGNTWATVRNKLGSIYQGEENIAKMAAYIGQRQKGMGIEDAWKAAESATFNYAQVTPFVRKLRTSLFGFPFVTFTVKATPVAIETALKNPKRISVFGKIKNSIEGMSDREETDKERAAEPGYIKDGFYIKLPIKDKEGRSAYFDLTYIIPFGDLMSGNFFDRQTNRETGLPEGLPSAIASKSPVFNLVKEIGKNQDFYGDKIWQDSDPLEKQMGDLFRHLSKTYLPPLVADQMPGGYKQDGTRRYKGVYGAATASSENEQRNVMEEMLRQVGAKIQPIDADIQETYQEWNKRKALETMLREKGVGKEFSRFYIPKEE